MRSRALVAAIALGLGLGTASGAEAKVYLSRLEALEAAFPGVDRVDEKTHVLDETQVRAIEQSAHARLESKLVTVYTGVKGGRVVGYALIDVHTVRTLPEAFLIVISPQGEVTSLRMLAFYEPEEYLPSARWLGQFEGESLSEELSLNAKIHGIAGSSLSSRAVTDGVRRALALHEVLTRGAAAPAPSRPAGAAGPAGAAPGL